MGVPAVSLCARVRARAGAAEYVHTYMRTAVAHPIVCADDTAGGGERAARVNSRSLLVAVRANLGGCFVRMKT